jgi:type VI secretion system protein ImpF
MAKIHADQPLIPSVLDRLIDNEPDVSREAPQSRGQVLREMKAAVQRDLENLLNTRQRCVSFPPHFAELKKSLVNYGIPDFLSASMASARDREAFCRSIQAMLRQYEPRFKSVEVKMLANNDELDRTLRFRIDAMLYADPTPEPVVFDSTMEPATCTFAVKGVA